MTLLFGICLAVGGVTALLSVLLGGQHDTDADAGVGGGADAGADGGTDAGPDAHTDIGGAHVDAPGEFWLLLSSTRFWVFFLTFFGLSGLLLQATGTNDLLATILATAFGLSVGLGAAWVFRRLLVKPLSSALTPDEMIGAEARVLLPVAAGSPGKVRLEMKGMILDRVAVSEGEAVIARGERALVIAIRGDRLLVSRAPTPALGDGNATPGGGGDPGKNGG